MPFEQIPNETIDKPLRTEIDTATDINYTFVADTTIIDAATSAPVWRCYRITNATGSLSFAINPDNLKPTDQPVLRANIMATYAY